MRADFSTLELQYQTTVVRNARLRQDATLEPWDREPEALKPTMTAELQCIAAFSPHGGLSYESVWEYLFLYSTVYALDAPYENAADLRQLVLTFEATFAVRYLSAGPLPLHTLQAAALDEGACALRALWRVALDAQLVQAGYNLAFRNRYALVDVPVTLQRTEGALYQQDEPLRPGPAETHDWLLFSESDAGPY